MNAEGPGLNATGIVCRNSNVDYIGASMLDFQERTQCDGMGSALEKDGMQLVCSVSDGRQLMGQVVIDSTVSGRSRGGLRMMVDVDEPEIRALARAMTLKFGFLGLPQGGAKAGLRCDPEAPMAERRRCLAAFGQAIAPLLVKGLYIPFSDMGTNNADIQFILDAAGVRGKPREFLGTRSGYFTAVSVLAGAKAAASYLAMDLSRSRVAIEGFGKVGSALAALLALANIKVVAISTSKGAIYNPKGLDTASLIELASHKGSQVVEYYRDADRIERGALLELPVDVLFPCARQEALHLDNAPHVRARIIAAGANNPFAAGTEEALADRGVVCLPYFVTNCGGTLGTTMEFASVPSPRIECFVDHHIRACVGQILRDAEKHHVTPVEIAEPVALRRFADTQRRTAVLTWRDSLFEAGLALYRRGWLPKDLVGSLSLPYFKRTVALSRHWHSE